jgi:hypothetical protein
LTHTQGVAEIEFAIPVNGVKAWPYRYPMATFLLALLILLGAYLYGVSSAGRNWRIPFLHVQLASPGETSTDQKETLPENEKAKEDDKKQPT